MSICKKIAIEESLGVGKNTLHRRTRSFPATAWLSCLLPLRHFCS